MICQKVLSREEKVKVIAWKSDFIISKFLICKTFLYDEVSNFIIVTTITYDISNANK